MFKDFLTQLKKLSINCGFSELRDSLIKDRIISSIAEKKKKHWIINYSKKVSWLWINGLKCVKLQNLRRSNLKRSLCEFVVSRKKIDNSPLLYPVFKTFIFMKKNFYDLNHSLIFFVLKKSMCKNLQKMTALQKFREIFFKDV